MRHYKRMTIFQNLESTRTLVRFKKLTQVYFDNVDRGSYGLGVTENAKAKKTRSQLNLKLEKVKKALSSVEVSPNIPDARRVPAGERQGDIDLVENIFTLHERKVEPQTLVDYIERAIGVYRDDRSNAWIRTLNPLYWLSIFLDYVGNLPSLILGSLGLDRGRFEGTTLGRLLKGAFRMAVLLALAVVVIHYLGFSQPVKSTLQGLLAHLKLHTQEAVHQLEDRTDEVLLKLQDSLPESLPEQQDPTR